MFALLMLNLMIPLFICDLFFRNEKRLWFLKQRQRRGDYQH